MILIKCKQVNQEVGSSNLADIIYQYSFFDACANIGLCLASVLASSLRYGQCCAGFFDSCLRQCLKCTYDMSFHLFLTFLTSAWHVMSVWTKVPFIMAFFYSLALAVGW